MKTNTMMRMDSGAAFHRGPALLLGLAKAACSGSGGEGQVDDGTAGADEHVGSTSQAITAGNPFFWGTFGNSGPAAPLASAAGNTCYLTGVHGQLLGTNGGAYSGISAGGGVSMQWASSGSIWQANTLQGGGSGFNVQGTCIPFTANRVVVDSSDHSPSWGGYAGEQATTTVLIPASAHRQCFLTGIWSRHGYLDASDYTLIRPPGPTSTGQDPNNWQFITRVQGIANGGSIVPGGSASAVCVDVPIPQEGGVSWYGTSPWHFTTEANIECGLTGILGNFALAGNGGVQVTKGNGWTAQVDTGKGLWTTCVK